MKNLFLTLFSLFIFLNGFSQSEVSPVSVALRGKYYVFGLLEDLYWRGYSYGGEVHFRDRHAIGVDGGMFRTRSEIDNNEDTKTLYSDIYRRNFVYIDYKYLFRTDGHILYAQVYTKQHGRFQGFSVPFDKEYENEYPEEFQEAARGNYAEYGAGVGGMFYFNETNGKLGIDVNLNFAYRTGSKLASYYEDGVWKYGSESDDFMYPYLRFTLFYHFFRFRKN